jgi:hypothetical protein
MLATRFGELIGQLADGIVAHFPEDQWTNAAEVAYLESRWNPLTVNDSIIPFYRWGRRPGDVNDVPSSPELSIGCFQINILVHDFGRDWPTLFDPFINAWAADRIFRSANGWTPWYHSARALGLI